MKVEVIVSKDEHYQIPLNSLSMKTVELLCTAMNCPSNKICTFRHSDKLHHCSANVIGFLYALGYGEKEKLITQEYSPMCYVLDLWEKDRFVARPCTVGTLVELLHEIERYDVLYKLTELIQADIDAWNQRKEKMEKFQELQEEMESLRTNQHPLKLHRSISAPEFDAIFSYDTSSTFATGFVDEIFDRLSAPPYNLHLCKRIDDLLVPGDLKMNSFVDFLDNRWRRVIVILTKKYLQSETLKHQLHASRINGVKEHKRKVIPVEVEPGIKIPDSLLGIVSVRYFNTRDRQLHFDNIYLAIKHEH